MMTSEFLTKQLRMESEMEFLIELHVLAGVELAFQALHILWIRVKALVTFDRL
jgi:hypothetical protein